MLQVVAVANAGFLHFCLDFHLREVLSTPAAPAPTRRRTAALTAVTESDYDPLVSTLTRPESSCNSRRRSSTSCAMAQYSTGYKMRAPCSATAAEDVGPAASQHQVHPHDPGPGGAL
jgi:hypothetical protein